MFTKRFLDLKDCKLEAYGSYATGLYTRHGDVDLSVRHHEDARILSKLERHILLSREYSLIHHYTTAKMPVLRFKQQGSDVPFDVTVDDTGSAKMIASLLSGIKDIDVRFRQLVLLVKGWAMCNRINDASSPSGGLKSFALYVMVIFHLQTIKTPILPPLCKLCTSDVMQKLKGGGDTWRGVFDNNVAKYKKTREENSCDVYQLFYSFIKKFKTISRDCKNQYISAWRGEWVDKKLEMLWSTNQKLLWILEPIGESENPPRSENLARSVSDVESIESLFSVTYNAIKAGEMDDILNNLVTKDLQEQIERDWGTIFRSSPKVPVPPKTRGTDQKSRSSSPSYPSNDDEDKKVGKSSVLSESSLGLLACYLSDEEGGKHVPVTGDVQGKSVDKNNNRRRSSGKDYTEVETGIDEKHLKAVENSNIQDEKYLLSEKKDDKKYSEKRFYKNERGVDRRSNAEKYDQKQERGDQNSRGRHNRNNSSSSHSRDRDRRSNAEEHDRHWSNRNSSASSSRRKECSRSRDSSSPVVSRRRSRSPPSKRSQQRHSSYHSLERSNRRSRSPPSKRSQQRHSSYHSLERSNRKEEVKIRRW